MTWSGKYPHYLKEVKMTHGKQARYRRRVKKNVYKQERRLVELLFEHVPKLFRWICTTLGQNVRVANIYIKGQRYFMGESGNIFKAVIDITHTIDPKNIIELLVKAQSGEWYSIQVIEGALAFPTNFSIHNGVFIPRTGGESNNLSDTLSNIFDIWMRNSIHIILSQKRVKKIKEELVAKAWHPERVAKWLEAGVALEDL